MITVVRGSKSKVPRVFFKVRVSDQLLKLVNNKELKKEGGALIFQDAKRCLLFKPRTVEQSRKAGAHVWKWIETYNLSEVVFEQANVPFMDSVIEGLMVAAHKNDYLKTKKEDRNITVYVPHVSKRTVDRGVMWAQARNTARWFAEMPSNHLYPAKFAEHVMRLGKQYGFKVKVWDEKELERKGFGGVLGVGKGSANPPRFLELEYGEGDKAVALVGKGVVFDTGGISLKPAKGMEEMKYDKTGASLIVGAFTAMASLKLKAHVYGFIPLVENVPSDKSIKPGDVITIYNGKTVEVVNTDAEGRLILADALDYASTFDDVKVVVDVATLTGAMIVSLGRMGIGYFSNDERVAQTVEQASALAGERTWRFPLWDEYELMLESHVADIKNIGSFKGEAGSITAAMFLKQFVTKPWAHLDIAGVMNVEGVKHFSYYPPGAPGIGMRTLYHFVELFFK